MVLSREERMLSRKWTRDEKRVRKEWQKKPMRSEWSESVRAG